VVFLAMSLIIVLTGLHTLREWQVHKMDCAGVSWLALAAPCPCCYGAVILTIALTAPFLGVSLVLLGKYAALTLGAAILASCLLAGQIVRLTKKPHPVLLGNLMLLVGFYFLACAVIMPNIGCLEAVKMSPLVVPPLKVSAAALGAVLVLGLYGAFKQTKKGLLR
jgi:predicted transporter